MPLPTKYYNDDWMIVNSKYGKRRMWRNWLIWNGMSIIEALLFWSNDDMYAITSKEAGATLCTKRHISPNKKR